MSDTKKHSSLMEILAVCTVFVALISFFLPFVSISFFGTYSYSALELIEEIIDYPEFPDVGVLISLVCTILGIVFSLLALKKRGMEIGTIVTSAVGMILMIVAMTSDIGFGQSAIDYAAIGFYLYEIASLAAIVLSISARYISKSAESSADGRIPSPAPKPAPKPSPEPKPIKEAVCPKCKAAQEKGAAFCRFCGTPLAEREPTPPVPEPKPHPNPIMKNGKIVCPHCGARHIEGTLKCKYCGTFFGSSGSYSSGRPKPTNNPTPMASYDPAPMSTPSSNPGPKKKDGKVICPHCGARHPESTMKCKYCGTSIR